jgi:D-proline reductase (dithiol) PrdA
MSSRLPPKRIACDCPVLPLPALRQESIPISRVISATSTRLHGGVLALDSSAPDFSDAAVVATSIDIISPGRRDIVCDSILDVVPVATKTTGGIGSGTTRLATGLVIVTTAREQGGSQAGEFGDSSGILSERLDNTAAGTPDDSDWIIRVAVTLRDGAARERRGPLAAHQAADRVAERIRRALREAADADVGSSVVWEEPRRPQGLRVLYAKMVMGQGAMHEKLLLPREPAGVDGGRSIIDLGHGPVMLRTNEVRDGGLHSLCCVSPSTKETTLHHFHDPLLARLAGDESIDLVGVAVFGSPASEIDKRYVAERLAALALSASPHGVIVATEGFGNNHIDWAHAIGAILRHGTPTVGVTWAARQGKLVVGNEYLVALVETNRSSDGRETLRVGENTMRAADADRAIAMLRTFIAGIDIDAAPTEWDPAVIAENQRKVAEADEGGLCEHLRSEIAVAQLVTSPLAPLRVPLSDARIALISAAGPLVVGDQPFKPAGDSTFREIPAATPRDEIAFGVTTYDHADVNRDANVMLPLDRLTELAQSGDVGASTASHFGFNGGGGDLEQIRLQLAPELLNRLRAIQADGVILTGG